MQSSSRRHPVAARQVLVVAAATATWIVTVVTHDLVQGVVDRAAEVWGFEGLQARLAVLWLALGGLIVAGALAGAARHHRVRGVVVWLVYSGLVAAAWATLSQTRAEAIHLTQYAVVALVWLPALRHPTAVLALCCALGAADEGFSFAVLHADRPGVYLDVNDMVLDALGATGGVLLHWSWRRR